MANYVKPVVSVVIFSILSNFAMELYFSVRINPNEPSFSGGPAAEAWPSEISGGSSVNCSGSGTNLKCNFRNICYSNMAKRFLFIDGPETTKTGIEIVNRSYLIATGVSATWDLYRVVFPEVGVDVLDHHVSIYSKYMRGKFLMVKRGVSDNIAHIFHDDLLPIFHTLLSRGELLSEAKRTILFADNVDHWEWFPLYKFFSENEPVPKTFLTLEVQESVVCFEDVVLGLSRDSVWYQYGVGRPEGPIENCDTTSEHLRNFTSYLMDKMDIDQRCSDGGGYGIFLSRQRYRRVLNKDALMDTVARELNMEMIELSLEKNDLGFIIKNVACADVVLGVHGALLVLSMFQRPWSVLLEMYPYALNPNYYTHYNSMTKLPGMDVEYLTWRNMNGSNTVTHEFEQLESMNIRVSPAEQQRILNSTEVPPAECCYDPEKKFRFNQDTVVDVRAIVDELKNSTWYKRRRGRDAMSQN